MQTKGAIGNLVNRYRAVLKKCTLLNVFGSLAVAGAMILGGAGFAQAQDYGDINADHITINNMLDVLGSITIGNSTGTGNNITVTDESTADNLTANSITVNGHFETDNNVDIIMNGSFTGTTYNTTLVVGDGGSVDNSLGSLILTDAYVGSGNSAAHTIDVNIGGMSPDSATNYIDTKKLLIKASEKGSTVEGNVNVQSAESDAVFVMEEGSGLAVSGTTTVTSGLVDIKGDLTAEKGFFVEGGEVTISTATGNIDADSAAGPAFAQTGGNVTVAQDAWLTAVSADNSAAAVSNGTLQIDGSAYMNDGLTISGTDTQVIAKNVYVAENPLTSDIDPVLEAELEALNPGTLAVGQGQEVVINGGTLALNTPEFTLGDNDGVNLQSGTLAVNGTIKGDSTGTAGELYTKQFQFTGSDDKTITNELHILQGLSGGGNITVEGALKFGDDLDDPSNAAEKSFMENPVQGGTVANKLIANNGGQIQVQAGTWNFGSVEIISSRAFEVTGGTANVENLIGSATVGHGNINDVKEQASLIADKLLGSSTLVAQGNIANDINGFIQIKDISGAESVSFTAKNNGIISVGQNGYDELTTMLYEADQAGQKLSGSDAFWYYNGAFAASQPLDLSKVSVGIGKDAVNNQVNVAANGIFIADMSSVSAKTADGQLVEQDKAGALITGGTVNFENGSGLHVTGVQVTKEGEAYILAEGNGHTFTDGVYVSSSSLYDVLVQNGADGLTMTAAYNTELFNALDASLAQLLKNYAEGNGSNVFLDAVLDNMGSVSTGQVAAIVEGATKVASVSGAPQQAVSIATSAADYATARTSFAPRVSGAMAMNQNGQITNIAAGDNMANGVNLWITPMYEHQKADGFKSGNFATGYDSDFFGFALGGDYTWNNSFRLGASINMGTGSSESNGDFAKTENDYDSIGVGFYAGYMIGNFGLTADINYTNIDNDLTQTSSVSYLTGNFDTNVFGAGLKAEYNYYINDIQVIPHLAVRYNRISLDKVNMKMAGVTALTGDSADANIWQFPIGVTVAKDFAAESGWKFNPFIDLSVIPVAGDKDLAQSVTFTGVNGIASTQSEIMDSISGRVQVGLEASKDKYYLGIDYAYQGSSHLDSHNVQATFGIKF